MTERDHLGRFINVIGIEPDTSGQREWWLCDQHGWALHAWRKRGSKQNPCWRCMRCESDRVKQHYKTPRGKATQRRANKRYTAKPLARLRRAQYMALRHARLQAEKSKRQLEQLEVME